LPQLVLESAEQQALSTLQDWLLAVTTALPYLSFIFMSEKTCKDSTRSRGPERWEPGLLSIVQAAVEKAHLSLYRSRNPSVTNNKAHFKVCLLFDLFEKNPKLSLGCEDLICLK
jgi:hypothetical protein